MKPTVDSSFPPEPNESVTSESLAKKRRMIRKDHPDPQAKQIRRQTSDLIGHLKKPVEEPTSSSLASSETANHEESVESLKKSLQDKEEELKLAISAQARLVKDLVSSVECPVCYNVPRSVPVPCCSNGHVICQRCKVKLDCCPTCRVQFSDCVSQLAATIIHRVPHLCEFHYEGCAFKSDFDKITAHESSCGFRLVRCPHWACDETITAKNLTHHVIAAECVDNYRDKPLPYKEEMEYARALDDEEGNGFWRPSLIHFDGITFYLQVEKSGETKNWYFYVQMEGNKEECRQYGVIIKVRKSLVSDKYSIIFNGDVCPIDIKGVNEIEIDSGGGLNVRNAIMENIFDVDTTEKNNCEEPGEVEGERFRFWVEVDIYKNSPTINGSQA